MKIISELVVQTVMDLLIHTNKQTTTKEVKETLRDLGYLANQADVSDIMKSMFDNSGSYERSSSSTNGNYFVYTFAINKATTFGFASDEDDEDEDDDSTQNSALKNAISGFNATIASTPLPKTQGAKSNPTPVSTGSTTTVDKEPTHIYYTESQLHNHNGNDNDWVVNHVDGNNEIHIFSGLLSRDTIRSRYASKNGVKIQDVRAKRWSNKKRELAN